MLLSLMSLQHTFQSGGRWDERKNKVVISLQDR